MPGTDPLEAMRLIFDELPDLPHLVELPNRGVGADMIGRTATLLIDLPVDTAPRGWRLADRPGRDARRGQPLLARDLDALEEVADGYQGPLKLQACGPWTMAASLELARSQEPVLADPGALRDLTASLGEGVAAHVAGMAAWVPGARLLLQLDEPSLPAVHGDRGQPGPASPGHRAAPSPGHGAARCRLWPGVRAVLALVERPARIRGESIRVDSAWRVRPGESGRGAAPCRPRGRTGYGRPGTR